MKTILLRCAVVFLSNLAAWPAALAQPQLISNEIVFKSGNWFVIRSSRMGSTSVGCTGFYKAHKDVQLSADRLIVKTRGKLEQIVVRYDDELSLPARPPSATEKRMAAVVLPEEDFDKLRSHKKLALEMTTEQARRGLVLQLSGLGGALDSIRDGCPAAPAETAAPVCSELLRTRMKANGVTDAQVRKICG